MASSKQSASITIPADYLEDVRGALIAEIHDDSEAVRADHKDVVDDIAAKREDRAANRRVDYAGGVRILREDMHLFDQVFDASGDTTMTGNAEAVTHVLEATVRVLTARLSRGCEYEPINMGAVVDLAAALRWAAEQAIRIEPRLDERKAA